MDREKLEKDLHPAVESAWRELAPYRHQRNLFVELYAGEKYAPGMKQNRPYNMISMTVRALVHRLVGGEPAVTVTSDSSSLRGEADSLRIDLNMLMKEIRLAKAIRRAVTDSLLSPFSVLKVGISAQNGFGMDRELYQEFAAIVNLDNFVFDNTVRDWDQCQFLGDRYMLPMEHFKYLGKTGFYDKKVVETTSPYTYQPMDSGPRGSDLTQNPTRDTGGNLFDMVELWDIYLPFYRKVVTFSTQQPNKFLRFEDYSGPDCGPYHILSYNEVPDQLIGKAPASDWVSMDAIVNKLLSKIANQAIRQKTVVIMEKTEVDVAKQNELLNAVDGAFVAVPSAGSTREVSFGGASPMNQSALLQLRGLASMAMGNLDQLTGQGASADTVGQEQLLQANSDISTSYMFRVVSDWLDGIAESMAWHRFHNPMAKRKIIKEIKGTDLKSESWFSTQDLQGDFFQYNFNVQSYSMAPRTPDRDAAQIKEILNLLIPLYPMLQQQNLDINVQGILERLSTAMNLPGLDQIVKGIPPREPRQEEKSSDGMSHERVKPPNTTRTVVRKSAGTSQRGMEMGMMNAVLGADE